VRDREENGRPDPGLALFLLATGMGAAAFFASKPSAHTETFNCKIGQCAAPQCEDNEHLATPPGQCCPVCVPN